MQKYFATSLGVGKGGCFQLLEDYRVRGGLPLKKWAKEKDTKEGKRTHERPEKSYHHSYIKF